ncbi:unnamed protein product [Clonostachys byssicola]|uniref:Uncharacterized protein n=1 Tax=Clonostachys byssicola TaxID=160290 RepID=A0A9N9UN32_9HYPO|nr:unnamed protein product [Clonostachys byssicola]
MGTTIASSAPEPMKLRLNRPPTSTGGVGRASRADNVLPELSKLAPSQWDHMLAEYGLAPMKDNLRQQWLAMNKNQAKPLVENMVRTMMEHAKSPVAKFKNAYKAQVDNLLSNNCHHVTDWSWPALELARDEIMQVAFIQENYKRTAMISWPAIGIIFWALSLRMVTAADAAVEKVVRQYVERYHLLDKIPTAIRAFQYYKECRSGVFIILDCPKDVHGPLASKPATYKRRFMDKEFMDKVTMEVNSLPRMKFSFEPTDHLKLMITDSRVKRQEHVKPVRLPPSFDVEEEKVWHRDTVLAKQKGPFTQLEAQKEADSGLAEKFKAQSGGKTVVLPFDIKAGISFFAQRFGFAEPIKTVNEATDTKITQTTMATVKRLNKDA